MSDTVYGLTVTLSRDISEEHAQMICNAIRLYEAVLDVSPLVVGPELHIAHARARHEFAQKIMNILMEK